MLDKIPTPLRHLFLMLLSAEIAVLMSKLNDFRFPPLVTAMLGAAGAATLAWLTPMTRQYGVGSKDEEPSEEE